MYGSGSAVPVGLQRLPGGAVEERLLDFLYQPIFDDEGRVTAVFVEGNDVTDRVRFEEQLEVSRGSLDLAAEMAEIGKLKRPDGRVVNPPHAPKWDN